MLVFWFGGFLFFFFLGLLQLQYDYQVLSSSFHIETILACGTCEQNHENKNPRGAKYLCVNKGQHHRD